MYAKFDKVVALLESVSIPIMTGTEKANGTWVSWTQATREISNRVLHIFFFFNFHQNEKKQGGCDATVEEGAEGEGLSVEISTKASVDIQPMNTEGECWRGGWDQGKGGGRGGDKFGSCSDQSLYVVSELQEC